MVSTAVALRTAQLLHDGKLRCRHGPRSGSREAKHADRYEACSRPLQTVPSKCEQHRITPDFPRLLLSLHEHHHGAPTADPSTMDQVHGRECEDARNISRSSALG